MINKSIFFIIFCLVSSSNEIDESNQNYVEWPDHYESSWLHNLNRFDRHFKATNSSPVSALKEILNQNQDLIHIRQGFKDGNLTYLDGAAFTFVLILFLVIFFQLVAFLIFTAGFCMKEPPASTTLSKENYQYFRILQFIICLLFLGAGAYVLYMCLTTTFQYHDTMKAGYDDYKDFVTSVDDFRNDLVVDLKSVTNSMNDILSSVESLNNDDENIKNFHKQCSEFNQHVNDKKEKSEMFKIDLPGSDNEVKDCFWYIWLTLVCLFSLMFVIYLFRIISILNVKSLFNIMCGGCRALSWILIGSTFLTIGTILIVLSDVCAHSKEISITLGPEFTLDNQNVVDYYVTCPADTNLKFAENLEEIFNGEIIRLKEAKNKISSPTTKEFDDNFANFVKFCQDTKDKNKFIKITKCTHLREKREPLGRALLLADDICKENTEKGATFAMMLFVLLACDWTLIILSCFTTCYGVNELQEQKQEYGSKDQIIEKRKRPTRTRKSRTHRSVELSNKPPVRELHGAPGTHLNHSNKVTRVARASHRRQYSNPVYVQNDNDRYEKRQRAAPRYYDDTDKYGEAFIDEYDQPRSQSKRNERFFHDDNVRYGEAPPFHEYDEHDQRVMIPKDARRPRIESMRNQRFYHEE